MNNLRDNRRIINRTRALDEYSVGEFVERIIIIIIVILMAITMTTLAEWHFIRTSHI